MSGILLVTRYIDYGCHEGDLWLKQKLKVTSEQVRCLIRKGQLAAINIGSGKKRPLYRITEHALHEFLDSRWQSGAAVRNKQFKRSPPVQDFFPGLK
jgi:hypothetical protein